MKKYFSLFITTVLLSTLLIFFCGCNEEKKAEKSVAGMFKAIKSLDFDGAQEFLDADNFYQGEDVKNLPEYARIILDELCGKLDYKIVKSEKINANKIIVTTEITALDVQPIMTDFIKQALALSLGTSVLAKKDTETKLAKIARDLVSRSDLKTTTTTVDIDVVKNDKKWQIVSGEEFENAMSGGLVDYAKNMK